MGADDTDDRHLSVDAEGPGDSRLTAGAEDRDDRLARAGVQRLRAQNPGPLTLSGTNTWVVGREPAWVVDPGPLIASHLDELLASVEERGGLGGIAVTHDHIDHVQCAQELRERFPAPLAAGRGEAEVRLREGVRFGPFEAVSTPGHAADHFALLAGRVCFTGDAVLGEGSVFIASEPGALAAYLDGLARLRRRDLDVLCPGHGPPIWTPQQRLEEYVEHRLDRERRLVAALAEGRRSAEELLDAAWDDVPDVLRPAAAVTLAAHLDKLASEGRVPRDLPRSAWEPAAHRSP